LILKVRVESSTVLKGHKAGPGERYVYSDSKNNPGGDHYDIIRVVKNADNVERHVKKHYHIVDSSFKFLGDPERDLKGLTAEVTLGDRTFIVNSPGSIDIPAGLIHAYRFIRGSGMYENTLFNTRGREYNAMTVDVKDDEYDMAEKSGEYTEGCNDIAD